MLIRSPAGTLEAAAFANSVAGCMSGTLTVLSWSSRETWFELFSAQGAILNCPVLFVSFKTNALAMSIW